MPRLGVNIDHIATVRQARREGIPDLIAGARAVVKAGADGITAHLREDRRHIQDEDLQSLKKELSVPLNMEMSISPDILRVALDIKPAWACLVPEKREELTTEGGLDVRTKFENISETVARLQDAGVRVSLFVDPELQTVRLCKETKADAIEIHTGRYARLFRDVDQRKLELERIKVAASQARSLGLTVNAGHGLDYDNVPELLSTYAFHEFNIGFSIVARALFTGLAQAVAEMKALLSKGQTN